LINAWFFYLICKKHGSYWYYDEKNSNNAHLLLEILQGILLRLQAGGANQLINAANYLSVYLAGFDTPPPGGAAVLGPIPCIAMPFIPALYAILQPIEPETGVNLTAGQNNVMQYKNDYANNTSGQGTILINNNPSIIFWGPENWA